MKSKITILPILLLSVMLSGCLTLAPKYVRPASPVPKNWPQGKSYRNLESLSKKPVPSELKWSEFFKDENLKKVIKLALNNNRDLKLAALNVETARAYYGIRVSELFPTFYATGNGGESKSSSDFRYPGTSGKVKQYSVNLGITSWELDFFGRIRSLKKEALESYLATEEAKKSVQIMVISEVARAYLALAADRERFEIAKKVLDTQQGIYKLIKSQYENGLTDKLALKQASSQVEVAREKVLKFTQYEAEDINALNLLVGTTVPEDLLPKNLNSVTPPEEISPGTSSEVLLNRPDIMAAEHELKAAYANIGAARAAFFPRISLSALIGTAGKKFSRLFKSGTKTWSYGVDVVAPVLDPKIWESYKISKAKRKILLTQYEKVIQTAFREVSDTLAVFGTVDGEINAHRNLVRDLEETNKLSFKRYECGIDSYLSVLDSERSLFDAKESLVSLKLLKMSNLVNLYAVLGGGVK